jgi:hypothetical protein
MTDWRSRPSMRNLPSLTSPSATGVLRRRATPRLDQLKRVSFSHARLAIRLLCWRKAARLTHHSVVELLLDLCVRGTYEPIALALPESTAAKIVDVAGQREGKVLTT